MRGHIYIGQRGPIQVVPLKTTFMDKRLRFCEYIVFMDTKTAEKIKKFFWENHFQIIDATMLPNEKWKAIVCIIYENQNTFFKAVQYFSEENNIDHINFNNKEDMEEVEWVLNENIYDKRVVKLRHDYFLAKSQGEFYSMISILKTLKYLLTK